MKKNIDIANRVVEYSNVESTCAIEDEVVGYLKRQMKVVFRDALFNNRKFVFIRGPGDQSSNSIMVSSYRRKNPGEKVSISFQ